MIFTGSSISNRHNDSSKNESKSSASEVYYSKMKFNNTSYKSSGGFYHKHKEAKVLDLRTKNKIQAPASNMISPISIKVDLLGHSFSTERNDDGSISAINRFSSKGRPMISDQRNLAFNESRGIEPRPYCKTPIGLKIKVEIPSKSDDDSGRYSNINSKSLVNQELLKENMSLKRKLEEANAQIELLKEELEKEQKSKTIQIWKFCREKNVPGFNTSNLGDYINKQLDIIK